MNKVIWIIMLTVILFILVSCNLVFGEDDYGNELGPQIVSLKSDGTEQHLYEEKYSQITEKGNKIVFL